MTVDSTAPGNAVASPPARSASSRRAREGGYRDTIESILIAFILAFIFRAFVVEAFVIPTGSMAPTLLGAHARFTCQDCGYAFEVNFSTNGDDQNIPAEVAHGNFPVAPPRGSTADRRIHIDCPNCGHVVHNPSENDQKKIADVPIHYGDRILVLKYAYLIQEPKRWDVVVFKSPEEPSDGTSWYTTNFIKRLVGRPGESIMVLDGDIYVSPTGGTASSDFHIQAKPRTVQDALWRIVSEGDFRPRSEPWEPWQIDSGQGWTIPPKDGSQAGYRFDAASGSGTLRFNETSNHGHAFTDWLAYAQFESGRNNVSDIKLGCLYRREQGTGPLRLKLTKSDDTFTAELLPGMAKLFRKRGEPANDADLGDEIATTTVSSLGTKPIQVDFVNVDYGVTLRVGGVDVLHTDYEPDVAALRAADKKGVKSPKPDARIVAVDQTCSVSHVNVWRDVYYTSSRDDRRIVWGTPESPVELGKDEYFVMGDNTVISADARFWRTPIDLPGEDLNVEAGRVPKRFMIGKAFFVYWPAGYRPFDVSGFPGIIPNFGAMRFIQ